MATQYGYGKIPVDSDLILHLDASDKNSYPGSGTTWFDISGNGYTATLVGPSFATLNGGVFNFTADGQYIVVNNGNTAFFTPNNLTVCCWVLCTIQQTTYHTYVAKWGSNQAWIFFGNQNCILDINNDAAAAASPGLVGTWRFFAGTYDRINIKAYTNGIIGDTTPYTAAFFGPNDSLILGSNLSGPSGRTLRGYMATTSIYSRALSADELLKMYNAQKSRFGVS